MKVELNLINFNLKDLSEKITTSEEADIVIANCLDIIKYNKNKLMPIQYNSYNNILEDLKLK